MALLVANTLNRARQCALLFYAILPQRARERVAQNHPKWTAEEHEKKS